MLTVFQFETRAVRTVERNGEPWFVAADVCGALDIGNPSQALTRLDDDEKALTTGEGFGKGQGANIVSEAGVYRLVFTSRKPIAERFKRWLAHEVLPAIRRTGAYAPQADRTELNLKLVTECRQTFGIPAARKLWRELGLPAVALPTPRRVESRTDFGRLTERVTDAIWERSGQEVPRRALMRRLGCNAVNIDVAIRSLTTAGFISASIHRRPKGGRPSTAYRWVSDQGRPDPVALARSH